MDGSVVYGSDESRAAALRTLAGDGKLKTSAGDLLPLNNAAFFPGGMLENENSGQHDPGDLFVAGDVRANDNVQLVALQTLLVREHNRKADELAAIDPLLTGDEIYELARRWVGGLLQHITYNEFLPVLLGEGAVPAYPGYDDSIDPQINGLFSGAAFRIGHSAATEEVPRLDESGMTLAGGPLTLREAFFNPDPINDDGIEPYLRGMSSQQSEEVDAKLIDAMRNFLFGPPGSGGLDLISLNIQRGRDLGLPSYNQARTDVGLAPAVNFTDISSSVDVQNGLASIYASVDDVDVIVGGLAEDHVAGAMVGELFHTILLDQFVRMRDGDRFWYENNQFTPADLDEIRATTFNDVILRNTDIMTLPASVFISGMIPAGPPSGGSAAAMQPGEIRAFDGTGNNVSAPSFGSAGENILSDYTQDYGDGISSPAGAGRASAREISSAIFDQSTSIPNARGATTMLMIWGQLIAHDIALTPGGTTDTLKVHGESFAGPEVYPFVAEKLDLLYDREVFPGVNNVLDRPIYLPVMDVANGQTIDPAQDTTVTTPNIPGASVFVAAGTLEDRQGNPFDGVLSITEVPVDFTPAALPVNLLPDLVVTIQPGEMVFTTPAPLTLPNRSGWEPGTLMDIWSINPTTGQFDNVGMAEVSADGMLIETTSGGIRSSSWHFLNPVLLNAKEPQDSDDECEECKAQGPFNSNVELYSGAVIETHPLVAYHSLGNLRGLELTYDSLRADVRPIIRFGLEGFVNPNQDNRMIADLTVSRGGVRLQLPGFPRGQYGLDGGEHFWAIPNGQTFIDVDAALQIDLRSQPSGKYEYTLTEGLYRFNGTVFAGGSATFLDDFLVVNSVASPFGVGWGLSGLQRLVVNPDDSVLLIDGGGSELLFDPPKAPGTAYESPAGDFSVLMQHSDGALTRTMKNRTVYEFDANGQLVSVTDRNGNQTQYTYENRHLMSIIDPVGLQTVFAYSGDRVSTITDPAGRVTTLSYDSAGNLVQIIDPDMTSRTFEYDADHHMTAEVDKRGNREESFYDFHGRAKEALLADGSVVRVTPAHGRGLCTPTATTDPFNLRVARSLGPAASVYSDGNGNVTNTLLDQAGQRIGSTDGEGSMPSVERNADNLITRSSDARGNSTNFEYDERGNIVSIRRPLSGEKTIEYPIGFYRAGLPGESATGDFNGDGVTDIVVANSDLPNLVLLLGRDDGTFNEAQYIDTNAYSDALATADVNGDGLADLIAASASDGDFNTINDVRTFLGAADGSLTLVSTVYLGSATAFPTATATGDLDGDGVLDIVVASSASDSLILLIGDGNGGFARQPATLSAVDGPVGIALADFNGDTLLDIISANRQSDDVSVFLGMGGGQFSAATFFNVGTEPVSVVVADFDADGRVDVATANRVDDSITVLFGDGFGSLAGRMDLAVGDNPVHVAAAEFDLDGATDLITVNANEDNLSVLFNSGGRTFSAQQLVPSVIRLGFGDKVHPIDANRDGIIDLGIQSGLGIATLFGTGNGTFATPDFVNSGEPTSSGTTGDFNADGLPDLALRGSMSGLGEGAFIHLNLGAGNFAAPTFARTGGSTSRETLRTVDLTGDGVLDLVVAGNSATVFTAIGNGDGTFDMGPSSNVSGGGDWTVGNFDGDSFPDIVRPSGASVAMAQGQGDGSFQNAFSSMMTGTNIRSLSSGDLNNDGLDDVVAFDDRSPGTFYVILNDGGVAFAAPVAYTGADFWSPTTIDVADVNSDGFLDVIYPNAGLDYQQGDDEIVIMLGDGSGTLSEAARIQTGGYPGDLRKVKVVNIDGDGVQDIIAFDEFVGYTVLVGLGDLEFARPVALGLWDEESDGGDNEERISTADFNQDGLIDLMYPGSAGAVIVYPESVTREGTGQQFSYDPDFSRITSMTDELGRQIQFEVDPANGNTLSITEVIGQPDATSGETDDVVTLFTYTAQGLVDTMTDPLGRVTDYEYDSLGRLVSMTFALGTVDEATERFEYDAAGNVTAIINANGNRTAYEYDDLNRLTRIIEADPDGPGGPLTSPVSSFSYDKNGNVTRITDARGNSTTYDYDSLDRRIHVTDAQINQMSYSYDPAGNRVSVIDPLGRQTRTVFDTRNRVTETIAADGGVTRFQYDADNSLLQLIDPVANVTRYLYDDRNRLQREIDPFGNEINYEYDLVDNLVNKSDRNGRITEFEYDDLDRLIGETWLKPDEAIANTITYAYDAASNLVTTADAFSALAFTYDERDRVTTVDNIGTPDVPNVVLDYDYDSFGNIVSVADTIGGQPSATTMYAYDALNRMTEIQQTGPATTDKRVDLSYNSIGQFVGINRFSDLLGTQLVVGSEYTFDSLNLLSNLTHRNALGDDLNFFMFEYDQDSRITAITDVDGRNDYSYDGNDRLIGADHSDPGQPDETYAYDLNGNRESSHLHASYDTDTGNRLTSDGTFNYEYDDEGNLLRRTDISSGGMREFEWDHRNRLIAIVDSDSVGTDTQRVEFAYDVLNRRIRKLVRDPGGETVTHFVYDRDDGLLDFFDDDGAGPNVPMLQTRFLNGPNVDQVFAQEDGAGNVRWLLTDHLGTTRDLIDNAGNVINHITYDAYGNVIDQSNASDSTRRLFTGREFDAETGLYYYRARYYDPAIGRFLSEDPLGFSDGLNPFIYVGGDPLTSVDPFGMESLDALKTKLDIVKAALDIISDEFNEAWDKSELLEKSIKRLESYGCSEDRLQKYKAKLNTLDKQLENLGRAGRLLTEDAMDLEEQITLKKKGIDIPEENPVDWKPLKKYEFGF